VVARDLPGAVARTLITLLVEVAAVVAIHRWSRSPAWSAYHVLALAAAALFAYAWRAFFSTPAFDPASIAVVRVSNAVFAGLAAAAVLVAARRVHALRPAQSIRAS
jgi:hypothetical protein